MENKHSLFIRYYQIQASFSILIWFYQIEHHYISVTIYFVDQ